MLDNIAVAVFLGFAHGDGIGFGFGVGGDPPGVQYPFGNMRLSPDTGYASFFIR